MSEGNGHPYSWSAIFNGYDREAMQDCPFPAIPEYLGKQDFPADGLGHLGRVTHIWTQDPAVSEKIAKAAKIPNVVNKIGDLTGKVDAILLARDDAEKHYEMALPFLKAGLPIFIDKPLALSEREAREMFEAQQQEDQIFSCSSLRYAEELELTAQDRDRIGEIVHVEASVPKKWETYAVHVIEPLISQLPQRGALTNTIPFMKNGVQHILVEWKNISAYIKVRDDVPVPIKLEFFGKKGSVQKNFKDSYACFRASLENFIKIIHKEQENIPREETLEVVRIIEKGKI